MKNPVLNLMFSLLVVASLSACAPIKRNEAKNLNDPKPAPSATKEGSDPTSDGDDQDGSQAADVKIVDTGRFAGNASKIEIDRAFNNPDRLKFSIVLDQDGKSFLFHATEYGPAGTKIDQKITLKAEEDKVLHGRIEALMSNKLEAVENCPDDKVMGAGTLEVYFQALEKVDGKIIKHRVQYPKVRASEKSQEKLSAEQVKEIENLFFDLIDKVRNELDRRNRLASGAQTQAIDQSKVPANCNGLKLEGTWSQYLPEEHSTAYQTVETTLKLSAENKTAGVQQYDALSALFQGGCFGSSKVSETKMQYRLDEATCRLSQSDGKTTSTYRVVENDMTAGSELIKLAACKDAECKDLDASQPVVELRKKQAQ